MAVQPKHFAGEVHAPQSDWQSLAKHVVENPVLYAAAVAFILACGVAGTAYRLYSTNAAKKLATAYTRALEIQDIKERVTALEPIANGSSDFAPEAMYMMGETAFRAGEVEKARDAFSRLRETYPQYERTPDGVEGLGYIEEDAKNYDEAIKLYREVQEKWPNSFTARRQPANIGRALEAKGDLAGAIAAYREQLTTFPASIVAGYSQTAIDTIRKNHPELFPEETATPASDAAAEGAATDPMPELKLELQRDAGEDASGADSNSDATEPADEGGDPATAPTVEEAAPSSDSTAPDTAAPPQ